MPNSILKEGGADLVQSWDRSKFFVFSLHFEEYKNKKKSDLLAIRLL